MLRKLRLGNLLIEHEKITQAQLDSALLEQSKTGAKLGAVLIAQGSINEESLLGFLAAAKCRISVICWVPWCVLKAFP